MESPRRHRLVMAFLSLLIVGACGTASEEPRNSASGSDSKLIAAVTAEALPAKPGPDAGGKALEEEIFSDGVVSFSEYERSVLAALQCVRDHGFEVEGPFRYPDPNAEIGIEPGADPTNHLTWHGINIEEDEQFGTVSGACQAQWSYRVEQVWLRKNAPTQDEIQAWLERAWECARKEGMSLSAPPTEEEAVMAVLHGCRPWESGG